MKGQNTSTAVMQRRVEAHDSLDDYPTPPWATRAMLEVLTKRGWVWPSMSAREPAANRGYMVRALAETFATVEASDVHDYGAGFAVADYLFGPPPAEVDWTITNPPFRLAQQFIERALSTSRVGVAVIVRSAFLEGGARYEELFSRIPPALVLQHVERVPMVRGRYDPAAASATAYSWLIWHVACQGDPTELAWIAPAKARLFRSGDNLPMTASIASVAA